MSETSDRQLSLFSGPDRGREEPGRGLQPSDRAARDFATDPRHNVVLEASAGTGKTSVLVERYLNLLRADVEPVNVLAMTFTRQAAADMRGRIIAQLRADAAQSSSARTRWNALRDRLGEISISTVDAFCLALLREFPLEADLDPGFSLADETEVPRLIQDAVERALTIGARLAKDDSGVAALLARLGHWRTHTALTALLERRLVVPTALHRFLTAAPRGLTMDGVCGDACRQLADRLAGDRRQLDLMITAGPAADATFSIVARDLQRLAGLADLDPGVARGSLDRIREFFLTQRGTPRHDFSSGATLSAPAKRTYREAGAALASHVREVTQRFDRDVNVVMVRAVQRLFGIAVSEYQRELEARAQLDFSDVLQRAIELLRQMDEFARSRYRLESRYQHVLVDEFQDTSRAQWELVSLLVKAWGEGSGLVDEAPVPPTVFIVGDRKQSIYRFRDADGSVLYSAAREIASLRPGDEVRQSIAYSFRAVPGLLSFVNDLFGAIAAASERPDGFTFESHDRFPLQTPDLGDTALPAGPTDGGPTTRPLGVAVADDVETCASTVASEIQRLLGEERVRSTDGSGDRTIRPGDIAILFRARQSHREFDRALEQRSIPTYVYKGLGFFDADEIKDVRALVRFLANPASELTAAALLRSRFARLSDPALVALAGRLSESLIADSVPQETNRLPPDDAARLLLLRQGLQEWLDLVDRLPPAEVLDRVLLDAAYARELNGPHVAQARENLKKMRALIRKLQNRGYATMARMAEQIDHLSGDIATAVVEAFDAVHLMTVHAAKGLEFPVVFLVDLGRGTGAHTPAVRVVTGQAENQPSVTVWPYRSDADDEERWRDVEETKRLLYVASTRARDRLYLSTVLSDGTAAFNRGSFGELLPDGFAGLFEAAGDPHVDVVQWRGPAGLVHELRTLSPGVADHPQEPVGVVDADRDQTSTVGVDLTPVGQRVGVTRRAVTVSVSSDAGPHTDGSDADSIAPDETEYRRLCGRVVHQLLQRFLGRSVADSVVAAYATQQFQLELPLCSKTIELLAHRSVEVYQRLCGDPDLVSLRDREFLFEVPFSFHDPSSPSTAGVAETVTGTIDCLARGRDNRMTVLEFKTDAVRPEHRRQLDAYVVAARAMFPGATVDGRIVYAPMGTNRA